MKTKFAVILTLLMLFGVSCSQKNDVAEKTVIVKVDTVKSYGQSPVAKFPGRIKAASEADLSFKVSGVISRIPVKQGSFVRKGQLLAQIDPRDYQIQLSATEAEYNLVKNEANRVIGLYDKQSVSQSDYEKAYYGLQQISAKYNAHKNALADTRLVAPFDGYVQEINYEQNETVGAGMSVMTLINSDVPEVEINIPSSDYVNRENFKNYYCQVDVFPNEVYPLDLVGINQKANLNQLYSMHLKLNWKDKSIMPTPGMSAIVTVEYKTTDSAKISVPISAICNSGDKSFLWIYDSSKQSVAKRFVSTSEVLKNGNVVIGDGLKVGEVVVVAGVNSLSEGMKVKLLPAKTKSNVGGLL